ncbi:cobalamin B12-binding domain-containing protein [Dactylosporangium vinaceum]|uniref:B12-binding domain-containing protein n=1 Tax=Dactylosporangium vinaceum TaxID=53362 RepID=A0ABV5MQ88_9ACTN|nr:cobalamin-dependent protein [Dactylosporangium vinaceum]UAB96521.1 cobalamin B12-binding domain-containing protein [Dactylosporangium vinaceum]
MTRTYFQCLAERDGAAALRVCTDLLDAGRSPVDVLLDIVAPAQHEVGQRWASGEWTVAHEHAATAISESVAVALGARIPVPDRTRGHVVMACAEREWHGLPARLVAYALQEAGWQTTFLGASTSPAQFARFLDDVDADAVAISCSVAASLPAARRMIDASREVGLPVLVGGGAFGADDTRAKALGATAWAPDARSAVSALAAITPPPLDPAIVRRAGLDEHAELVLRFAEFRTATRSRWPCETPLAEDALDHALHSLSATLLTNDPRLLHEADDWLSTLFKARNEDPAAVGSLWTALRATVGEPLPEASRHLAALTA